MIRSTQDYKEGKPLRHFRRMSLASCALLFFFSAAQTLAADMTEIKTGFLRTAEQKVTISLIDLPAGNDGLAGAELAAADNNTTGKFLNQKFSIVDAKIQEGDDPAAAAATLAGQGVSLVIADLPADALLKAADWGRSRG